MNKNIEWFKKIANKWEVYQQPIRPSLSEIKIWRKYLPKKGKALVLGATPELRDMAHSLDMKVVACDMNVDMLVAMTNLMRNKSKAKQEVWIKGLWTNLPIKDKYFDAVVGDFVLPNIPHDTKSFFYKEIARVLRPKGIFAHRVTHFGFYTMVEVMDFYSRQKPFNSSEFDYIMQTVSYDHVNMSYSLKNMRRDMKRYIKDVPVKERSRYSKLLQKFNKDFPFDKTWYSGDRRYEERLMKKFFTIKDVVYGNDHRLVKMCPIYILKKR